MLRNVLRVASSPTYRISRQRWHPSALSRCRCFSDGNDGDDENEDGESSRMSDIYSDLFGLEDEVGGADRFGGGGGGGAKNDLDGFGRFGSRQQGSRFGGGYDEDDDGPSEQDELPLEVDDLPVPLFSDCIDLKEEDYHRKITYDEIPDWSPSFVSRISKERVQLLEDGIPTLSSLAVLPLPPPPFPHPGHGTSKEYAILRRKAHQEYIREEVRKLAEPKIARILALTSWQAKQDAVDELFESVESELRNAEPILQRHPRFGSWVEKGLESYLRVVARPNEEAIESKDEVESTSGDNQPSEAGESEPDQETEKNYPTMEEDNQALPVFMDCYNADDEEGQMVPSILTPLKPHHKDGPGRMVEEFELAAHRKTKRIMLRQSTRAIARALQESESARVFVTGRRGVGKTAALISIVASARKSGCIVLYMPDGNRLHRHGYYIEPSLKFEGMFDLPMLSQEVCQELLSVHETDFEGMEVDQDVMEQHFTEEQLEEMTSYTGGKMSLVDVLKEAQSKVAHAPMCYTIAVEHLMKQDDKPFLMVLDEFNCYYEPGHYFHMDYDFDVNDAIPYDQINLFKPALDAMALSLEDDEDIPLRTPVAPKRGGVVVGISESCAIARKVTDSLSAYAIRSAAGEAIVPLSIVDVPRYSELEVDHVIANFECIGLGHLRGDQGEAVMNEKGIAYLRMHSSKVGQNLLDVCCT